MIIKVKERITHIGKNYVILSLEDVDNVMLDMLKKGMLEIVDQVEIKDDDLTPEALAAPGIGVYLVSTEMIDNGDYDFEDEYHSYYETKNSYYRCAYCPSDGSEIKVEIIETEDVSKETTELSEIMDKYSCAKQPSKKEIYNDAYFKYIMLVHSSYGALNELLNDDN